MNKTIIKDFCNFVEKNFNIKLTDSQLSLFDIYFHFLIETMNYINISTIKEEIDIYYRHFADSLSVYSFVNAKMNIVDVGFGAGFPSIPLKIINPNLKLTLIEVDRTKCIFIKQLVHLLGFYDILVINDDINNITTRYDLFISRAFTSVGNLLSIGNKILKRNGALIYQTVNDNNPSITGDYELKNTTKYFLPVANSERLVHFIVKK
jgi:16S rRNA (guanine527-N7)-methyltransferase